MDPYPLADSLAATIFTSTEEILDDRFVRVKRDVLTASPPPEQLSALRQERMFGWICWLCSDNQLILQAQIPPHQTTPVGVMITMTVGENDNYFPRLERIGLPVPDDDPAFIVGKRHHEHGKTTVWIPGPGGLDSLHFRSQGESPPYELTAYAELPLEAEHGHREDDLMDLVDLEGTLRFENLHRLEAGEHEEHIRPGRFRTKLIL